MGKNAVVDRHCILLTDTKCYLQLHRLSETDIQFYSASVLEAFS